VPQLYRYRHGEGIACVSCPPSGAAPIGSPDLGNISPRTELRLDTLLSLASNNLAAQGERVFFETPDPLVASDANGKDAGGKLHCPPTPGPFPYLTCIDVYEWEAQGTGSCTAAEAVADDGCLYLLSDGTGDKPALLADASQSGEDAFFFTRESLVGQDEDELQDVYDSRIGGGLASQNTPPSATPIPCESAEACHGQGQPAPPSETPGTSSFIAPPNKSKGAVARAPPGRAASA
jgi:hypothetical protein